MPDISLTAVKFPDISRLFIQVDTLSISLGSGLEAKWCPLTYWWHDLVLLYGPFMKLELKEYLDVHENVRNEKKMKIMTI